MRTNEQRLYWCLGVIIVMKSFVGIKNQLIQSVQATTTFMSAPIAMQNALLKRKE